MNSDSELRNDVQAQLANVLADPIDVEVTEGVVTLTGMVHSDMEQWAVEDSVRYMRGVKGLVNQTVVGPASPAPRPNADIARPWFS